MFIFRAWFWFFLLPALFPAKAAIVNRTIDDTYGDGTGNFVEYFPKDAWHIGAECTQCTAKPDPDQLFSGSWHDGGFFPVPGQNDSPNQVLTATVNFNGSAIYVFCVLTQDAGVVDHGLVPGTSDLSFYIDDVLVGTRGKHVSPNLYEYQAVYVNESLSPGAHIFTLANGHVNGSASLVLLDKIVYSFDDEILTSNSVTPIPSETGKTSGSSHIPAAAIYAPLVLMLLILGIGIFWFWRRHAIRTKSERTVQNQDTLARPFYGNFPATRTRIENRNSGKRMNRLLGVPGQSQEGFIVIGSPPSYYSTP